MFSSLPYYLYLIPSRVLCKHQRQEDGKLLTWWKEWNGLMLCGRNTTREDILIKEGFWGFVSASSFLFFSFLVLLLFFDILTLPGHQVGILLTMNLLWSTQDKVRVYQWREATLGPNFKLCCFIREGIDNTQNDKLRSTYPKSRILLSGKLRCCQWSWKGC